MSLKLKLGMKPSTPADNSPAAPSGPPKIKLKMSGSVQSTPVDEHAPEPPKQKRKYNKKPKFDDDGNPIAAPPKGSSKNKKRAREDNDDEASPPAKRKSKGAGPPLTITTSNQKTMPKLKLKARTPASATPIFKLKYQGRPPPRPLGVGYDSECDDAEVDPPIFSQYVLRMLPGADCDALRKAIDEKKVGKPISEGGFPIHFRHFDAEARRSIVVIGNTRYAATMVDLPCIVESMKSWNKRDWVKSADICQMLLVLGVCKSDEEAKNFMLPPEVDQETHQYAHGLTPPMHWVRKRRFRKRENFRKIEEVEAEVERLLEADRLAVESGGKTDCDLVDMDMIEEPYEDEYDDEDDAMNVDEDGYQDGVAEEDDEDDGEALAKMMEAELAAGGDNEGEGNSLNDISQAASSHDVAMHALGTQVTEAIPSTETPASPSVAETNSEGDDDDDEDSDEDVDDEALAAQQELAQQREEIADLEKEIADAKVQLQTQPNALLRQRIMKKIQTLQNDLDLKKTSLGDEVD